MQNMSLQRPKLITFEISLPAMVVVKLTWKKLHKQENPKNSNKM